MKRSKLVKSLAGAALIVSAGAVLAFRPTPATTTPTSIVQQYVAAQNAHQIDLLGSLVADTIQSGYLFGKFGGRGQMTVETRAQHMALVAAAMKRFPKIRFDIVSSISNGNIVVTTERLTGIPTHGPEIGMSLYRVNNGKLDCIAVIRGSP